MAHDEPSHQDLHSLLPASVAQLDARPMEIDHEIFSGVILDGKHGPGRPKMTWKQLTERDCREWKLSVINPHDRHTWRSGVRSAMPAASQLSGRGPLMWMLPLNLHVNQKSVYDDDDIFSPADSRRAVVSFW